MKTDRVDAAIDEVARQMTEDAPAGSADVRRRVLARIEAGAAPRRSWRAAWMLTPLAVAAAIVMAIFVPGPKGPALRVPVQVAPGPDVVAVPKGPAFRVPVQVAPGPDVAAFPKGPALRVPVQVAAVPKEPALVEPVPQLTVRLKPPFGAAQGGPEAAEGPDTTYPSPSLEALAPAPLDMPPLAVPALTRESMQIEPLNTIAPIDVAPLGIDEAQRRFE